MNLKELVHAQSHLLQHRHSEADLLCKQAYYLIAEAEAGDFAEKALLKQALQLFTQAARQQRRYPEPYIGLAYLAILLEQRVQAQRYLQTVLSLAPQHADAAQLLHYLSHPPETPSAWPSPAASALPQTPADLDQLHEQLEHQLYAFVRQLMQQPPPEAGFENATVAELRTQSESLAAQIQVFEQQLVLLEGEFDTADLRRRLRPAEAIYRRYQAALTSSELQMTIHGEIIQLIETVRHLWPEFTAPHAAPRSTLESQLEKLMDRCDWLADRLDELGAEQALETLEYRYHALVNMLEELREKLDEYPPHTPALTDLQTLL